MCKWQDAFAGAWRDARTRRANALPDCDDGGGGGGGDGDDDDDDRDGINLRAVCLVRAIVECVDVVVWCVDDEDGCW